MNQRCEFCGDVATGILEKRSIVDLLEWWRWICNSCVQKIKEQQRELAAENTEGFE